MSSAEHSVIPEFVDKINRYKCGAHFNVTSRKITNLQSGSEIIFSGIKTSEGIQTAKLKSLQGITTWVLDEAEELPNIDIFNDIDESIRQPGIQNRVILVLNPKYVTHWLFLAYFQDLPDYFNGETGSDPIKRCYIYANYKDNLPNLSDSFVAKAEETKAKDLKGYYHRYLGKWGTENKAALWTPNHIRHQPPPKDLIRIVVAIDPATTAEKHSDLTGIVVCGKAATGEGYVLADHSGRYSPEEWVSLALRLYDTWQANEIVAEVNQGGDMVKSMITRERASAYVRMVRATKGKATRAEPVVALYEKQQIFHSKHFPELEMQMLTWGAMAGEKSPDRIDAMVWGFSELMLKNEMIVL